MLEKRIILRGILVLVFLMIIFSVQAAVQITDLKGQAVSEFSTSEDVYIKSDAGLCNNAFDEVSVFIVKSGLKDNLSDVRGNPQNIKLTTNFAIPLTKIWSGLKIGEYDALVDCDKDGKYGWYEPVVSFNVKAGEGNVSVSVGEKNIGEHSWQYDPEDPNLLSEALQIELIAGGEDVRLENMVIEITGGYNSISKLEVYLDKNNNGKLNGGRVLIGSASANKNMTSIPLNHTIIKDKVENILVVYNIKESAKDGNLSIDVISFYGLGVESGGAIEFLGVPLKSAKLVILPKKTCKGSLVLELDPNLVDKGARVIAKMSNLTLCKDKKIYVRKNPCDSEVGIEIGSCVSSSEGCNLGFRAVDSGNYYACVDKNNDGDMTDPGESASAELVLNEVSLNESGAETEGPGEEILSPVTGEATKGLESLIGKNVGVFLVVLELTLLLILFVLIIISFKLGSSEKEEGE